MLSSERSEEPPVRPDLHCSTWCYPRPRDQAFAPAKEDLPPRISKEKGGTGRNRFLKRDWLAIALSTHSVRARPAGVRPHACGSEAVLESLLYGWPVTAAASLRTPLGIRRTATDAQRETMPPENSSLYTRSVSAPHPNRNRPSILLEHLRSSK